MPFSIIRNDISLMNTDAIVNTANPHALVGSGVDSSIHKKAGIRLFFARKKIGDIAVGQAVITPAYDLNAKYVIHTVGPQWIDGAHNEIALLTSCYQKSLNLALSSKCQSIAFPLISSGTYGFPKDVALQIAINVISQFLMQYDMMIYLVVFDKTAYSLSEKLFTSVQSYIDENYVETHHETSLREESALLDSTINDDLAPRYAMNRRIEDMRLPAPAPLKKKSSREAAQTPMPTQLSRPAISPRSLDDLMEELEETFSESLFRLIDAKGLTDPQVYKKANIDRKLFSKIRTNKNYKPSKITAIALAVALELNLDETKDFIGRAGYALTHSSKFDIIIEHFIVQGNYNIFELNEVLFAFDQPILD